METVQALLLAGLTQLQWGPVLTRSDPGLSFAVTSDLSGPGSPPALLPGFRNAPPWGPERANQNEEEPQRAVGDWRRGERGNINNKLKKCIVWRFWLPEQLGCEYLALKLCNFYLYLMKSYVAKKLPSCISKLHNSEDSVVHVFRSQIYN